jgi:PhnB protein
MIPYRAPGRTCGQPEDLEMAQNDPRKRPTLIPSLTFRDTAKAIEFYRRALGAEELARVSAPDGKAIWHAELRIGDSYFFLADEMPGMGAPAPSAEKPVPVTFWVGVPDCDAAYKRAVDAGAKGTMPPADMFWGDRAAWVADPFGYVWTFAHHVKDMTEDEIRRASEEFARSFKPPQR